MAEAEREINRLWRAWRTVHEMVKDRGYGISDEEIEISYEDFKSKYAIGGEPTRAIMQFQANPTQEMIEKHTPLPTSANPDPQPQCGSIWVEFAREVTIGVKQITNFMLQCEQKSIHTGLLITQQALSGPALRATAASSIVTVQTFREQDLLVNISQHELVPQHVLLSHAEKKALLEKYRLKESQLPRIQLNDPMAKYLGLKRGDVVKIIRKSETAGRYASYRWCV